MNEKGKNMKVKSKQHTTIIGGQDGPVSIFIAGKGDDFKMPLKDRIRNKRNQIRRKRAEKKIQPTAHTKEETITYAREKYGFLPLDETKRKYKSTKNGIREGIICEHRPDLLGEYSHIRTPDITDKKSLQEWYSLLQERDRIIESISDDEVPMDFQMYELLIGEGYLEMALDFRWDIFGVSYGGDRKHMKKFRRIAQDLYSYYGVTEEDIKNKTKRYYALVCALSDF